MKSFLFLFISILLFSSLNAAVLDSVTVKSTTSANVLIGPHDSAISPGTPFTNVDFNNARNGSSAIFIGQQVGSWIPSLPADAGAQWIGTPSGSGLFAVDFEISNAAFLSDATIDLYYAVDNYIGEVGVNEGAFINGVGLTGSAIALGSGGHYTYQHTYSNDISGMLNMGVNTLYMHVNDVGFVGGVIFSATISTSSAVPEPSTYALMFLGLLGLGFYNYKRKKK